MRAKRVVRTTVEELDAGARAQAESLLARCGHRTPEGQLLVVRREGLVLGAAAYRLWPPDAELLALVIDPNDRHRGLGRLLVLELARRARSAGCSRLRVRLPKAHDAPFGFFRRLGFEDTEIAFDLELSR